MIDHITLILSIIALCGAGYVLFRILRATPVEAWVVAYDEQEQYDPDTGSVQNSTVPIYRYTWNGVTQTYRSRCALLFSWIRKDTNRIYISKTGKVYEKEMVIALLIIAVILFLIG